jgi:hypothetical protein
MPLAKPKSRRIEMKRRALASLAVAATAFALLGASAEPASATANHYIHMSAQARIAIGESTLIHIDGTVAPPAEFWDMSWILAVALPGELGPECPGDASSAGSIAEESGAILAIALRPNTDEAGNFANSVSVTGRVAGPILICGYLYNEVGYTWAAARMPLEIVAASGGDEGTGGPAGGGKSAGKGTPVNLRRPWVTYAGKRLVCHKGRWSSGRAYAYAWYIDGTLRRTKNRTPYAPLSFLRRHSVACKVTAYGSGGKTSAMSQTVRFR